MTRTRYLLTSQLAKHGGSAIHLSVVELPRADMPAIALKNLVERWAAEKGWDASVRNKILSKLPNMIPLEQPATTGVCHSAAGLIASFLYRQQCTDPSKGPERLLGTFANDDIYGPLTIGVADRCCPICQMLADEIHRTPSQYLDLYLPVHRSRFYRPWVPPHWLSTDLTLALEKRLLDTVFNMAGGSRWTFGASSDDLDEWE
ncbi:hypothetical protein FB45DRAFT_8586 [Roridomyces roridus]|uniref:Uncharacterized protein n=1 Tax=Roridomyces roridus TaxID=1738132 RepID=A0AAD7G0W0_9AGAR|nr:hypothetical protein FB45DRAFT_8586 [Roridomyces roridus]